ncbi:MAG: hypothetical protein KatS3mg038_1388 [Candidatus Kapaibacterium sp.]|nr:MAG: hypothetical protein KatS3mg038_1388 [Candidatus Kapabacteria bacterium]
MAWEGRRRARTILGRPGDKAQSWAFYGPRSCAHRAGPSRKNSYAPRNEVTFRVTNHAETSRRQNVALADRRPPSSWRAPGFAPTGLDGLRVVQPPKRNTGHSVRFNGVCRRYETVPKRLPRGIFAAVPRMVTKGGVFNFRTPRGFGPFGFRTHPSKRSSSRDHFHRHRHRMSHLAIRSPMRSIASLRRSQPHPGRAAMPIRASARASHVPIGSRDALVATAYRCTRPHVQRAAVPAVMRCSTPQSQTTRA